MNKLTKLFRKTTIFGMALTSFFGSPPPIVKLKEDGDDGESRLVEEDGIISPEYLMQGQWSSWTGLDEDLYRYESLENLVSFDNEVNGKFWKVATLSSKDPSVYSIRGVRSDDVNFEVSKEFDIRDRDMFDDLCREFNKKLSVEIA